MLLDEETIVKNKEEIKMEELTNVTEEVVTEVTDDEVTGVSLGTVATGVCALTGVLAIGYGAYRGIKWAVNKVKTVRGSRVMELEGVEVLSDETRVDEN